MRVVDPLTFDDPLLAGARVPFVRVVEGFLDEAACVDLIARIERLAPALAPINSAVGAVMRPDIRNNERVMFDDGALAETLYGLARPLLPAMLHGSEPRTTNRPGEPGRWDLSGLNERFRGYRYGPGQRFAPHFDGCFARSADEMSAVTFIVYLDEGCTGGETILHDWAVRMAPKRGALFLFDHYLRHEGASVLEGVKHVLRTDVMYRRG